MYVESTVATWMAPKRKKLPDDDSLDDFHTEEEGGGGKGDITFEKIEGDLEIRKVETSKDEIVHPLLARDPRKIIPPLGSSVIICGKSGSGKSTLLQNYLTDPRFYGKCDEKEEGWFDKVFIFSPTAGTDDVLKSLNIPKEHVFTDMREAPELLEIIQNSQKGQLEGSKANQVRQICVIFEDVIGETQFMNTPEFKKMFYMVRHLNATTFICTQHWMRVPKVCRLQAGTVHFFAGSAAEVALICEEFAPPMYSKREFCELVNEVTKEPHAFLTICMKVEWKWRYRRNLNEFITLSRLCKTNETKEVEKQKGGCVASKEHKSKVHEPDKSDPSFCEPVTKLRKDIDTICRFRKAKGLNHGSNEQAEKIFGEWSSKGARGRTIW